ncbi:MAG: M23 family metallopeptidase [Verrucomicrobiales bacterium]
MRSAGRKGLLQSARVLVERTQANWNGGSGDTDLGAPIHTVADGVVIVSEDVRVGWGNCIIVRHAYRDSTGEVKMVDSQYAHLLRRMVNVGDVVKRGQQIGTMGNNRGMYLTHLHFEMRKNLQIGMNRSRFSRGFENYYDPTRFINAHRKLISDWRKYPIPIDNFAAYNAPAPKSTPKEKIEVPTPKDTPSELEDKVRKKLPKEIADILDKAKEERDTPSDEEMEGLWQRFKQIIKLKKKSD